MKRLRKARMTPLQRRFIQEYLVDLNGTQAAVRAGYSPRCASSIASTMMRHCPQIVKAISDALATRELYSFVSKDRVLLEYARIAFADIREMMDWGPEGLVLKQASALSEADAAAISEVTTSKSRSGSQSRLRLHDKKSALDALVRLLGFVEKSGEGDAASRPEGQLSAREILLRRIEAMTEEEKPNEAEEEKASETCSEHSSEGEAP
jgi:phage terminase small subunit